jgi:hypothetical protein
MTTGWAISAFFAAAALALAIACEGGAPTAPSFGALATFAVGSETFHVYLTTTDQVVAARFSESRGLAHIPRGRIVPGMQLNLGWSWHLEDVAFVETALELCDGRPSDVERVGIQFGGGRFCSWSAINRAKPLAHQHAHEIQAFGYLVKLPIALAENVCKESVANLNQLIADDHAARVVQHSAARGRQHRTLAWQ